MRDSRRLSASAALAAFAESFASGRRVVVYGNALGTLPDLLLDRGARLVHVCDPDPGRAAQAGARNRSQSLSFAPLGEGPLALREGAFDVAVIENLCAVEPSQALREVRRLLGPRGVLLVACPNREGPRPLLEPSLESKTELDYYALYDAVANEFSHVRMLGQAPFVGYAVAEFSPEGDIEPVIDTAFLERGSEEPEYFLALAAQHRASAEAYALVQLPLADVLSESGLYDVEGEIERLRGTERQHRKRIAELEAMLARGGRAGSTTASLEHKLLRQDAWIRELEERAATADARADSAEQELEELRQRAGALPPPAAPATSAHQAQLEDDLAQARSKLADLETRLAGALTELAERDRRLSELTAVETASADEDLAQLEQQLVERGQEIRRLERDLREAERVGRELLRKLGGDPALLRQLAEAQADRLAAVWAVEALRAELTDAGAQRIP